MPYSYILGGPIFCEAAIQSTAKPFSVAGARPRIPDLTSSLRMRILIPFAGEEPELSKHYS